MQSALKVRIRIYNSQKKLIVDSESEIIPDQALSQEAQNFLAVTGLGTSTETSKEFGKDLILYKNQIGNADDPQGYVLSSLPSSSYETDLETAQRLILTIIITTSIIAILVTYLLVSRIVRSLEMLKTGAERVTEGIFDQELNVESRDELESLADSFNQMSSQLKNRIARLNDQKLDIQEGSERLRTVLGAMIEGVIAVDENQRILFANRAALNIFEINNRDYINRQLVEAVRHPGVLDVVDEVLHRRRLLSVEIEIPRKDIVLSVIASRLPGEPASGVVMVFHDMTELRRLENVRREFVSNVSHELKTPLASIQAYTDTLLEGGLEDSSINRKFLERIDEQAERLHMLIVDVIKIAQVESGQEMFDMKAINLNDIAYESVQDHQAIAESKQITLHVIPADEAEPVMVHADTDGLRTIFDNLLDNALKYTLERGRVEVRWTVDNNRVFLSISDTGLGIPPEHLGRIFERFYRVDKARSREMGGTGLGLSIVKHLAQVFGGSIQVESVQGEGTIFTVELLRA
ncbi:MAG: HAMP domain-containing protein [Planctomycetaceae bacterium]|nr:HAMP domain-containing protein [Planctomycetaceae bacterium]